MRPSLVMGRSVLIKGPAHLLEFSAGCEPDGHLGSAALVVGLQGKHTVFFGPAIHRRFPEREFDLPMTGERSGPLSHGLDRGKRTQKSVTTEIACGAYRTSHLTSNKYVYFGNNNCSNHYASVGDPESLEFE